MIRWFTQNGVAANLLAGIILVAGLFTAMNIKLELFPELDLDIVSVSVPYPGAAPEEVESGIIELIEDRIQDVDGVKKITATAGEGYGSVLVEVERGYDATEVSDKIKVRVDAIDNFPEEAEEAQVEELLIRNEVISLAIYGDTEVKTLKEIAEYIRDELNVREGITQVDIKGIAEFEISINVSEVALRQYGLTFDDVAQAIRNTSVDIPGGSIKSRGGEILLRTTGKAYTGAAFEDMPVITRPDGSVVRVRDLASVEDGFVDDPLVTEFNGQRAVLLRIYAVGDESALDVSGRVQNFAQTINADLPAGIHVEAFRDLTYYLKGRLQMLIKNGIFGLLLVLLILTLFLRPSLAFFVMLGIPISFLGSMLFLPMLGISINLASLFGFILVLGIVVDDAIIVGESVFTQFQRHGGPGVEASVAGTKRVSIPVTFAVLTTIVAFLPILTIPGFLGKFFYPIPVVVIATLIWSLIESKLVLPYHLTLCNVGGGTRGEINWLQGQQRKIADGLERFIKRRYRPVLKRAIQFRYATVAAFIGILLVMFGMLAGKHLPFVFFPPVPSDYIVAKLVMPAGTPVELTTRAIDQMQDGLEQLIEAVKAEGHGEPFDNAVITIGAQPFEGSGGPMGDSGQHIGPHIAEIAVELVKREDLAGGGNIDNLSAPNLANRWREMIGPVAGVKELSFNANAADAGGKPIDIQISGRDFVSLQAASEAIKAKLSTYEGLFDIKDNYSSGKREIKLDIRPSAEPLGLRQSDLGRQVRAAFYGVEAQRIQRGRDDIKVMVRYPLSERQSVENLEDLRIRTLDGHQVPFDAVADFEITDGFAAITRVNRRRVINITADADKRIADLGLIKKDLAGVQVPAGAWGKLLASLGVESKESPIEAILTDKSGITWSFEGEAREQADIFASLGQMTLIALFIIYALLAIPLKSYIQPLIVMIVIPFGLIGAIGGHIIMGQPMSILSVLGFVALAGVVVNDSLVLVDFINQERAAGIPMRKAIEAAGALRFRPIILTSLTTFAGLLPVLFETSLQAQFLIPMAISLSFGVLFATFITLLLVPAFYSILEDIRDKLMAKKTLEQ
jgi:multidrug efflux pump subunit AcrB